MALPRQVEAQLKELEEIEKQLAAQQNPQGTPVEPDPQPAEPAEPVDPIAPKPSGWGDAVSSVSLSANHRASM